jgi:hypothetical protein
MLSKGASPQLSEVLLRGGPYSTFHRGGLATATTCFRGLSCQAKNSSAMKDQRIVRTRAIMSIRATLTSILEENEQRRKQHALLPILAFHLGFSSFGSCLLVLLLFFLVLIFNELTI